MIQFDFNNMTKASIGKRQGIAPIEIEAAMPCVERAFKEVVDNLGKGWQEWTELPYAKDSDLQEVLTLAESVKKFDSLVVLGIGGSALGTLTMANALLHLRHNELPRQKRNAPKLYVEDNVDPERMNALLDCIDLEDTFFNVVTKSGETSETLSQFLVLYALLKEKLGQKARDVIAVTTTDGKGTLYEIAKKEGFKLFSVPKGVGGRFSIFSNVGLLPMAACGMDVKAILEGAKEMSALCQNGDLYKNPALFSALMQYISMKKGSNISVLMPYADSLKFVGDFYCQLWGESLGKAVDKEGREIFAGQTPVRALGVTDQHSQIQLYTEGPFDKVVTFLKVEKFRSDVLIPRSDFDTNTAFLQNHNMSELINAEMTATEFALKRAERANFCITLSEVNAFNMGALIQYMMYQTAFAGALLNVDTFNQPGVEEGKKATFAMFGRAGYEEKLQEILSFKRDEKLIINF